MFCLYAIHIGFDVNPVHRGGEGGFKVETQGYIVHTFIEKTIIVEECRQGHKVVPYL